jgi:hypothetical protein
LAHYFCSCIMGNTAFNTLTNSLNTPNQTKRVLIKLPSFHLLKYITPNNQK